MQSPPIWAPQSQFEGIAALFLGPKAENSDMLINLLNEMATSQLNARKKYHKEDLPFISSETQNSAEFGAVQDSMAFKLRELQKLLGDKSIPFYSPRYSGHMCVDQSLPAILAYVATMFYNPNNVAFEASPVTSAIEVKCGLQLCRMIGYESEPVPWGHITSGGTVANLESMWAARNLKFYPLSVKQAVNNELPLLLGFRVKTCSGTMKTLGECSTWELLNLDAEIILDLPQQLVESSEGVYPREKIEASINKYIIQFTGKDYLKSLFPDFNTDPVVLAPKTKHYSWPKAAAVLGIGYKNLRDIKVDTEARMSIPDLELELETCLKSKTPVYQVVTVIGSTEEGSIDRLEHVLALRDKFRKEGLTFVVHADAAWGGYFATMIDPSLKIDTKPPVDNVVGDDSSAGATVQYVIKPTEPVFVPHVGLRLDSARQLAFLRLADSVTIDPHKAGYVPYPAGALCYRDKRMTKLVTWSAPYLDNASTQSDIINIGIYGIEGSKPGAAPVAAYIAHNTIGLNPEGYGALLGEAMYACRRYAAHWSAMSTDTSSFTVTPFNKIPAERKPNHTKQTVEEERQFIRQNILFKSNEEIYKNDRALKILNDLGSDLNINVFACNFRLNDGTLNTDIAKANRLNMAVVNRLSVTKPDQNPLNVPFYLTSTVFKQADYGDCATEMKRRMGLPESSEDLVVLRNVVLSPFTTVNEFIDTLIDTFQEIVEEEVDKIRNEVHTTQEQRIIQRFVFHGSLDAREGKGYLVNIPSPKSPRQIIISVTYRSIDKPDSERRDSIANGNLEEENKADDTDRSAKQDNTPGEPIIIETKEARYLSDILASQSLFGKNSSGKTFRFTLIDVLKDRPLSIPSPVPNPKANAMYFYIYGSKGSEYLSSIVTTASTLLLNAGATTDKLKISLEEKDLEQGNLIVEFCFGDVDTAKIQNNSPQLKLRPINIFELDAELPVTIYKPVSSDVEKVTDGVIKLSGCLHVDKVSNEATNANLLALNAASGKWENLVTEFEARLNLAQIPPLNEAKELQ